MAVVRLPRKTKKVWAPFCTTPAWRRRYVRLQRWLLRLPTEHPWWDAPSLRVRV